mmetsp:Transcript_36294/g.80786  ORF Transcript_36294/g.80786 Transcript_36294/m.80786 type:complete len:97 (-) Transcript_36294:1719-2009(-)
MVVQNEDGTCTGAPTRGRVTTGLAGLTWVSQVYLGLMGCRVLLAAAHPVEQGGSKGEVHVEPVDGGSRWHGGDEHAALWHHTWLDPRHAIVLPPAR